LIYRDVNSARTGSTRSQQQSQKLLAEFPMNNWIKGELDTLLKKLKETGTTNRKHGSGSKTEENVSAVKT